MAYLGTPIDTTNQFQSLQGKRFSGDGSTTAFTLDIAPSSVFDIEVFVENVRQDPNSAYSLSGTTLTFTGAPPSGTNNIYVVHQAKAVGTIDVPNNSVGINQLNLSDGSSGQFLKTDGSGTISFATVSSVGGATGVDFNDNVKARFGTGNDLEIYHDGSNSYVVDNGTGDLYLQANDNVFIQQVGGSETFAKFTKNGSVELYHDNSKKIETTSGGIDVTGTVTVNGSALGQVVQSAMTTITSAHSHGATSFQTAGSASAFTPTSASNKILILGTFPAHFESNNTDGNDRNMSGRLIRNQPNANTQLHLLTQGLSRTTYGYRFPMMWSFAYLDTSYNTTNAITYAFQTKGSGGSWDIYFQQNSGASTFTILELSA